MWLVYGIISGIIVVVSIGIIGYRVEYYAQSDTEVKDEVALALASTLFWPIIAPIAAIWGVGYSLARRKKQITACSNDPNKYSSQ